MSRWRGWRDTLDALVAKIDSTTIAAHSPQHKEEQQRLQTIAGVGPMVGMALTNTLERVPVRNADAFVHGLRPESQRPRQ